MIFIVIFSYNYSIRTFSNKIIFYICRALLAEEQAV